jgi:small subunit ribosomal protein S16
MPTKIRLQRRGKRGQPFYHIVIADGRAPRDGRFIERIGTYNPLTKPADIIIDFEKAISWLRKGATPTETVRAIFSYKGVLYKNHLLEGMKKGALTAEQVEEKFQVWQTEKQSKISGARKEYELELKDDRKKRLAEETKVNEAKAGAIAKKLAAMAKAEAEAAEAAATAVAPAAEAIASDIPPVAATDTPEVVAPVTPEAVASDIPTDVASDIPRAVENDSQPEEPKQE